MKKHKNTWKKNESAPNATRFSKSSKLGWNCLSTVENCDGAPVFVIHML